MALMKCQECGNDVSTEASACPKCGAKPKPKKKLSSIVFGVIILFLIIGWIANSSDKKLDSTMPNQEATPAKEIFKISAQDLYLKYEKNEVAADNEFHGKIIEVTGEVASIDKDFMDNVVIKFVAKNEYDYALMKMEKSEEKDAATLSKGLIIGVRCQRVKRIIDSPVGSDCVFVRDNGPS